MSFYTFILIWLCARQNDINACIRQKNCQCECFARSGQRDVNHMIFEDKILIGMQFWQIKHTNNKLALGWSMCQNSKRMCLAKRWVPSKTMLVFTSFSGHPTIYESMLSTCIRNQNCVSESSIYFGNKCWLLFTVMYCPHCKHSD